MKAKSKVFFITILSSQTLVHSVMLPITQHLIDHLCDAQSKAMHLPNLMASSIGCVARSHQSVDSLPHHFSPVELLLDSATPVASLPCCELLRRLSTTNTKLVLLPQFYQSSGSPRESSSTRFNTQKSCLSLLLRILSTLLLIALPC